jgi:hypothetical protein
MTTLSQTNTTLLTLTGMGVTPYSARGLTQTLEPISAAVSLRRTVNGTLVDVSAPQFRKYRSTISCTDQQAPAIDGIYPGLTLTVGCIAELSYITSGGTPKRTPVTGSSRTEGPFTFYRPSLSMKVTGYRTTTDEYGSTVGWQLDLEEV